MFVQKVLNCVASFTYMFGKEFFVETPYGNFVWNDPEYGGDNTFTPFRGDYKQFSHNGELTGRDKGRHVVRDYCGDDIRIRA